MPVAMWVVIGAVVLILLILWATYNSLVKLNERVNEAWSDISVQLKYRADLIPNLVEIVKGYAKHEREVFENVTKARSSLLSAKDNVKSVAAAENAMTKAIGGLFAIAENYPQLKANENFMDLQQKSQIAEDKIQAARRFYNSGVKELNIKIKVFPSNVFAKGLGFSNREFFEVDDREKLENAPKISF